MKLAQESVDRTRRIETRLTKYLAHLGFETGARKPVWAGGVVEVPSPSTSLVDCLSVVPDAWDREGEIAIMFRGRLLGCVLKP